MSKEITNVAYCPHCGNTAPQRLIHTQRYFEKAWQAHSGKGMDDAPWSAFVAACSTCGNVLVYDNPGDQTEEGRFSNCELVYPKAPFMPYSVPSNIAAAYLEAAK